MHARYKAKQSTHDYTMTHLAQAHFVADDAAGALRVQLPEPLHAGALVVEEAAVDVAGHAEAALKAHVVLGGV